jgi:hypothetical protein
MVLARPRVRSTTEINLKNNLYPLRHFTEHLVGAFEKSSWERFELRNLESFDPVTQELYRLLPATIHNNPTTQTTEKIEVTTEPTLQVRGPVGTEQDRLMKETSHGASKQN